MEFVLDTFSELLSSQLYPLTILGVMVLITVWVGRGYAAKCGRGPRPHAQRKLLLYLTLKVEFTVLFFDTFKRRRLSGWQYPCLPENTSAERCLTSPTTAI